MLAAFVLSLVSVAIAAGSLVFVRRANGRAARSERRTQAADWAIALERIGWMMRETAATARTPSEPQLSSRLLAVRTRLLGAIDAAGVELPACTMFATTVSTSDLPVAEIELEEAIANARDAATAG
jgi:hypothetical protein